MRKIAHGLPGEAISLHWVMDYSQASPPAALATHRTVLLLLLARNFLPKLHSALTERVRDRDSPKS